MPTIKPRVAVTMTEEQAELLDAYRLCRTDDRGAPMSRSAAMLELALADLEAVELSDEALRARAALADPRWVWLVESCCDVLGGPNGLAFRLGITTQTVSKWRVGDIPRKARNRRTRQLKALLRDWLDEA